MKKLILTLTAITSLLIVSCHSDFKSPKESFSAKEAAALLKGDVLLVDVRDPGEVAAQAYDVKNVINIPLDSLESKLSTIPKDKQVLFACQKGGRSQKALELSKQKGFMNTANLEGGMDAWSEAGLPTKGNTTANTKKEKACCSGTDKSECKTDASGKCLPTAAKATTPFDAKNRLEIYAFHGTRQCETCKNMKANTKATLDKYFASELKSGKIVYQIIDVDDEKNAKLAEKFQATGTALMINKVVNGKDNISDWSDFAFDKANDASAFIPELKSKIQSVLK
jgi:rhodanese-related sulfurtransferase